MILTKSVTNDVRTHVVLPKDLVKEVDRLVGPRKRSDFMTEAVRQHVRRLALAQAFKETAGILAKETHPEWSTPEKTSAWVRKIRSLDNKRLQKKYRSSRV